VSYETDILRESDMDAVVKLHRKLMPRKRGLNERYLRWKYYENPYIGDPLIVVIRYEGEVVAITGLMGMGWSTSPGQTARIVPQPDDLFVHPAHRRKGLVGMLYARVRSLSAEMGFPALVVLSGGGNSNPIAIAKGWTLIRELDRVYLMRGDRPAPIRNRIPGLGFVASKGKGLAKRLGYSTIAPPSDRLLDSEMSEVASTNPRISVSTVGNVEAMSALASAVNSHASDRSVEFLRWRFANPDRQYRFVYWDDDRLRGYMIVGWAAEDHGHVRIVDHCSEDLDIFIDLLAAVIRIQHGTIELMFSTLPEREAAAAYELGFRPDDDRTFRMRRFLATRIEAGGTESPILTAASSWRVDLIDTLHG